MTFPRMISHASPVLVLMLLLVGGCGKSPSPDQSPKPGSSDLSPLVVPGDTLRRVTGDYRFDTAGSPLYRQGQLYFTNNNFEQPAESRTLRLTAGGVIDTLASDNGVTTTLQASGRGTMYACQMLGHRVVELDTTGRVLRVVAGQYQGKRIDGPNDLVVDAGGGIYVSDSQFIAGRQKMQETPAVYYVDPEGAIRRVIDDIPFPNGLGLSPDGQTLYVANTQGTHLLAYDVQEDGNLGGKRAFARLELADGHTESGADGMAVDSKGNVYVATTHGLGVQVFDSTGHHRGNIATPTPSNNVSFGGPDGQTLYISARDGIYSLSMQVKGR